MLRSRRSLVIVGVSLSTTFLLQQLTTTSALLLMFRTSSLSRRHLPSSLFLRANHHCHCYHHQLPQRYLRPISSESIFSNKNKPLPSPRRNTIRVKSNMQESSSASTSSASSQTADGNKSNGDIHLKPSKLDIAYNFARGHPNASLLPVKEMQQILHHMSSCSTGSTEVDNDADMLSSSLPLKQSLNYLKTDQGNVDMIRLLSDFIDRHTANDDDGNDDRGCDSPGRPPRPPPPSAIPHSSMRYFMTHGVSHGIELLCKIYTKPNDIVLVECPTYFLATKIFLSHGLKVQPLPMKNIQSCGRDDGAGGTDTGSGGVDVEQLAKQLEEYPSSLLPRMIYIIPTHQNPTARTMSTNDRIRLSQLALHYNILIVADEVYHLLDWRRVTSNDGSDGNDDRITYERRPARMAAIGNYQSSSRTIPCKVAQQQGHQSPSRGRQGRNQRQNQHRELFGGCVSVNSFTKIFSPGVRCGWIEGPPTIVEKLMDVGYIISQGCCVPFVGEVMRVALQYGYCDEVLKKLLHAYQERSQVLIQILKSEPLISIDTIPVGGYFVWITFQRKKNSLDGLEWNGDNYYVASDVLKYCREHAQVNFLVGETCDSSFTENRQQPVAAGTYDKCSWEMLPEEAAAAAAVLGYTQDTWDNAWGSPLTDDKAWNELSPEQMEAAETLGYTKSKWDEDESDDKSVDENSKGSDVGSRMVYKSGLPTDCCHYSARLCFADLGFEDLVEGAKHLVHAFQEYHAMKTSASPPPS